MAKILVVDNNDTLARLMQEVLSAEGHQVALAGDGGSALSLVETEEFDIAFIDLILPDFCGLEILQALKRKGQATIPIVISGQVDINCAIASINAGVFHYLRKPFDIDDINRLTGAAILEKSRLTRPSLPALADSSDGKTAGSGSAIRLVGDLLIATMGLLVGFIGIGAIFKARRVPFLWGDMELAYMLASFACCYGFVYFNRGNASRGGRQSRELSGINSHTQDFIDLIYSYILFSAVLFFVTSYGKAGYAILAGAGLGLVGFWFKNKVVLPKLAGLWPPLREGRKKITIKNRGVQSAPVDLKQTAADIPARLSCNLTCLRYGHAQSNKSYQKAVEKTEESFAVASADLKDVELAPSGLIRDLFGSRNLRMMSRTGTREGIHR